MPAIESAAEPQLNATPLIDVLLVLLVMLIFTLPVMTHATKLNLPQAWPRGHVAVPETIRVGVEFDGTLTWNDQPLASPDLLETKLRARNEHKPAPRVMVRADPRSSYGPVAQVLAATQRAQVTNLGISGLSGP